MRYSISVKTKVVINGLEVASLDAGSKVTEAHNYTLIDLILEKQNKFLKTAGHCSYAYTVCAWSNYRSKMMYVGLSQKNYNSLMFLK